MLYRQTLLLLLLSPSVSVLHACLENIKVTVVIIGELVIGSGLQDVAITYDKENVTVSNSAEAMSDDDRSSPLHSSVKGLLHDLLTLLIQGRCSFIQYEDLRILNQSPCNCYSLLLAAGKFAALQSTFFSEALMESENSLTIGTFFLLLLDHRLLQLIEPLVDKVHLVIGKVFSDEHRKLLHSVHSLPQSCMDSKCVEAAVEFGVFLNGLTDHKLLLAVSKLGIDSLEFIPPFKVNHDIGPAGAILLRNLSDRINKYSIVLVSLLKEGFASVFI